MTNLSMPQNIDEAIRLADLLSKSTFVPPDYRNNPGNVLLAIQWGAELGLAPVQSLFSIAPVNGRPSLWGDAVLGLVKASGLLEMIEERLENDTAICRVKRRGEDVVERRFSVEDAKRAGLWGKRGPWQAYPKRMLQMRARALALRDVFPDVLKGIGVVEEMQDVEPMQDTTQSVESAEKQPEQEKSKVAKLKARMAAVKSVADMEPPNEGEPDESPADATTVPDTPVAAGPEAEADDTETPDELPDSAEEPPVVIEDVIRAFRAARTEDELRVAAELAAELTDETEKKLARAVYMEVREKMRGTRQAA